MTDEDVNYRILEFFCGIGGLHYGFEYTGLKGAVLDAFDISEETNRCYRYNFGVEPVTAGIDSLSVDQLDEYNANVWLMSPPCQPYVRGGKHLDDQDNRARALLHLIQVLPKLKKPPSYIFLENVVLFDQSRSRKLLIECLDGMGYDIMEFLISSSEFNVPNDRQRYYLCARNPGQKERVPYVDKPTKFYSSWPLFDEKVVQSRPTLEHYLESLTPEQIDNYQVPSEWILTRHGFRFEVVRPTDTRTGAFTKSYATRYILGTGAYLITTDVQDFDFAKPETLLPLRLRLFTPTEVARIHWFPIDNTVPNYPGDTQKYPKLKSDSKFNRNGASVEQVKQYKSTKLSIQKQLALERRERINNPKYTERHSFAFPPDMELKHQWRALGNSLSVKVVGELMKNVLFNHNDDRLFK